MRLRRSLSNAAEIIAALGLTPLAAASNAQAQAQVSAAVAVTPANLAARVMFSATKNGTNQTGIADATATKITFTTEVNDVGGCYDAPSSRWTPPPGGVRLSAAVDVTGANASTGFILRLYKNGAAFKQTVAVGDASGQGRVFISANDVANGTDYYEVYFLGFKTAGTMTCQGGDTLSYFQGEQI
jgi:hypothetical protein